MHTAATLVLLLSACDAPKGVPSETGGGPADSGPGRGDSETGNPASGCDSADRAGGDTADPDTGDNEDQCDGDLLGVRDVKLCGVGQAYSFGYAVSAGIAIADEAASIAIGSAPYGVSDDQVEVDVWTQSLDDAWLKDGVRIAGEADYTNRLFGRAVEIGTDLDGDGYVDMNSSSFEASMDDSGWTGVRSGKSGG